jgi:uncharacterized membrane protein
LGKASFTLLILTFIMMFIAVGRVRGDTGNIMLVIGLVSSLILALFSEKGRWKTITITSLILVFIYGMLMSIAAFFTF